MLAFAFFTPTGNLTLAALVVQDKTTIFAVIAGFLLTLLCIGLVFRRFSNDTSEYFRAGGKATWWLVGGSILMSTFSAWTFTGGAGAAFQAGWSLPAMLLSNAVAFLINACLTAAWYRQLRCVTSADLVRLRFGPGMEQFTAWLGMLTSPIYGGVGLYGLAIFTSTLLGLKVAPTIVVLGFVVLFYAALSGAWAVLAADFIKALLLIPISVLLAVICLWKMGGVSGLLSAIDQAGLTAAYAPIKSAEVVATMPGVDPNWFTFTFFLGWWANNLIMGNSFNMGFKFLTAKDGREARRAATLAAGMFAFGAIIWFIPPMTARLLIADQVTSMPLANPVEGAYAAIAIQMLPAGLVGLVLVGMCAATMSSLDVSLTALAGNITQNVYPATCRLIGVRPLEGRGRFYLGKFINLLCAVAVIVMALIMARFGRGGIFKILMDVMATIGAPLTVPLLLGLFVRRVPVQAPYVSIAAGFAVSLSIYLAPLLSSARPWAFQYQVGAVVAVSALSFFLVRAFVRLDAASQERETEFFGRRNRPIDFEKEVGEANDGRQLRVVGTFGVVLGSAVLLLLIPSSSRGHAWEICAVAAFTALIGSLLLWHARKLGRSAEHCAAPAKAIARVADPRLP